MRHNSSRPLCIALFLAAFAASTCTGVNGLADEEVSVDVATEKLAERIRQSLVIVRATGRDGRRYGHGTGFAVSRDGLIATARHVIGDRRSVEVELPDGKRVPATHVHAVTEAVDLAVLRIDAPDLVPLQLGDSENTKDGQAIVTVGYPGTTQYSVFRGLISGRHNIEDIQMLKLAMTVEPGSSGEPIVTEDGKVVGIVTLKSTESDGVGFAVPVEHLKTLLDDPTEVAMSRWMTIGALDAKLWQVLYDANWRQRASRILVDGYGTAFGGRSLCLLAEQPASFPWEVQVDVRLDNESGAAGLAFHSDGGERHYGFYPSAGKIRLTRFNGPDLNSWTILHNEPDPVYRPGEWNTFKVRIEDDRFLCFCNDKLIVESGDSVIPAGRIGLATFRGTSAAFRRFRHGLSLPRQSLTDEEKKKVATILENVTAARPAPTEVVRNMTPFAHQAEKHLELEARKLERKAKHIRTLLLDMRTALTVRQIEQALQSDSKSGADATPDLLRAALLVAVLDNSEIEPNDYIRRVDQLADEVRSTLPDDAPEADRLAALDRLLFKEYGFRGSRFEYYTRSNSYLNEVIDDREGLPIALSVLYMEIAKRLDLNIVGLGLPGHFVVRFEPQDENAEPQIIDVFDRGRRMTRKEAETLIRERGYPLLPDFFEGQKPRDIVRRMIVNLLGLAERSREDDRVLRYLEALVALDEADPEFRAKRLEMRARTGRLTEAIEDADWFINNKPEGTNVDSLYELRGSLEQQAELQKTQ